MKYSFSCENESNSNDKGFFIARNPIEIYLCAELLAWILSPFVFVFDHLNSVKADALHRYLMNEKLKKNKWFFSVDRIRVNIHTNGILSMNCHLDSSANFRCRHALAKTIPFRDEYLKNASLCFLLSKKFAHCFSWLKFQHFKFKRVACQTHISWTSKCDSSHRLRLGTIYLQMS